MPRQGILVSFTFLIFVLVFFHKIFWGLIPLPADLIVGGYYPWLDYKWGYEVGVPVKNPLLTDAVSLMYPLRNLVSDYLKRGELPLWNPYLFAGYPLIASLPAAIFFPTTLFYLFLPTPMAWTIQLMLQPLLGLIFMFLLLRHWRLGMLGSIFGAVVFSFGGFSLIWLEWGSHTQTAVFLPLMILLADKLRQSGKLWWGSLLSLAFALQIFAGYTPSVIFSLFALFTWYLGYARVNFKLGLQISAFLVLGLGMASVQLLPTLELFQISQRKYEVLPLNEAFLPIQYLITLAIPDFFGSPATGNFWGAGNYTNAAFFSGVIALIMAIGGVWWNRKTAQVTFVLLLLLAALLVSFQNPLSELLYNLGVWGGGSMTMNRSLFLVNFAVAVLSALGINSLLSDSKKSFLQINASVFTLLLIISLSVLALANTSGNDHFKIAFRNSILPTFFSFVSLLIFLLIWKTKKVYLGVILLTTLMVVELFRFGWKYNTFSSKDLLYPATPVIQYLRNYPNDRFMAEQTTLSPNLWIPFDLSSISGYEAVYPVGIAKIIAVANSHDITASPQTKAGNITNLTSPMIDQTNTRFLVISKREGNHIRESGKLPSKYLTDKYRAVFEDKSSVILENTAFKPRAFFVSEVIKTDQQNILQKMLEKGQNNVAYTTDFSFEQIALSPNSITSYKQIKNNHVQIGVNSTNGGFLVITNAFYPGWQAFINGRELKIYRTNYAFMGIKVPKGEYLLELLYVPKSFQVGIILSLISVLLALTVLLYEVKGHKYKNTL